MQIINYQIKKNRSNPSLPQSKLHNDGGLAEKVAFALVSVPTNGTNCLCCQHAGNVRCNNYNIFLILSKPYKLETQQKIKNKKSIDNFQGPDLGSGIRDPSGIEIGYHFQNDEAENIYRVD